MFRFFRHLRVRLIEAGNLKKYLLYAAGEIILVVIGILIALQINTANQGRINRKLERTFLHRMHADLEEDIKHFTEQIEVGRRGRNYLKEVALLIYQDNTEEDIFKFNELYDLAILSDFSPQYSTYRELESTGRLNLIHTESLRLAILNHYAFYGKMETDFDRWYHWSKATSYGYDAETAILKYSNPIKELFPPERRRESDWSYFNDPHHPDFRKTEAAVAARGYNIEYNIKNYSDIIEHIHIVQEQIEEALRE